MPLDFQRLSLSLCILLNTYTSFLCGRPPNPTPYNSTNPDSWSAAVTPSSIFIRSFIKVSLGICHAFLCLTYPFPPRYICPHPSNLAPYLFSWTPYSIICIIISLLGCYIRLSAFSALGPNFTFRLAPPQKLVTSGLYNYVQHPSYTGTTLIVFANWALTMRLHGPLGCWLPTWVVEAKLFWRPLACQFVLAAYRMAWKRVREEEMMMERTFGEEWKAWHSRTKRFIPGLF